ncbi:hypothetical protein ACFPM7_16820 [Actinokineospora guangxiensis]|uniref:Uncharacterized protein n=1 Tax=Actinokineospora guangxiensis TaxID=1490288 RepID=A0ABW0EMQ5_9PSEU
MAAQRGTALRVLLAGTTAVLAVDGELGAAEAVALIVVIVRFLEPFTTLSELAPAVESARGTLSHLDTVRKAPTDPPAEAHATEPPAAPVIEFDSVTVRCGETTVLDDLSCTIAAGATTGRPSPAESAGA